MTRMLSGMSERDPRRVARPDYERARSFLNLCSAVLIIEILDDIMPLMSYKFGWSEVENYANIGQERGVYARYLGNPRARLFMLETMVANAHLVGQQAHWDMILYQDALDVAFKQVRSCFFLYLGGKKLASELIYIRS